VAVALPGVAVTVVDEEATRTAELVGLLGHDSYRQFLLVLIIIVLVTKKLRDRRRRAATSPS